MMHKVSVDKSNKTGFTLIEIVLVMAILVFMIGAFFAVFRVIYISHAKVAVMNDAKDYAELNMEAITNLIVNSKSITFCNNPNWVVGVDDANAISLYFDSWDPVSTTGKLYFGKGVQPLTSPIFTYDQYTIGNGKNKWYIVPTFSRDITNPSKMVKVQLALYDNSSSSTDPYLTLTRSIYLPNLETFFGSSGTVMKCIRTTLG